MSNNLSPIYTVKNNCQDCCKCVRNCPVKAIRIKAGHAMVIPEMCVYCGKCVEVCPVKAKKVRNDLGRLNLLIKLNKKIIASLAPSWRTEFRNIPSEKIINAIKSLGFFGVSETALGAQEVSSHVAKTLPDYDKGLMISSACPSVVFYIKKYMPEHTEQISPFLSPLLSHAKMLKNIYGEDSCVVFFGPCIAKKNEADENPELLSLALNFKDLNYLFEKNKLDLKEISPNETDVFIPENSYEGSLYPIEGGMIETIKSYKDAAKNYMYPVSGLLPLKRELNGYDKNFKEQVIFVEALACYGGCINGPCSAHRNNGASGRIDIVSKVRFKDRACQYDITQKYEPSPLKITEPEEKKIKEALATIGMYSKDDELNCGGCGYGNCHPFAKALIDGRAETEMCVSFMRKQAQKKASAIIKSIPAGIVVVNNSLQILEHNSQFSKMFPPLNMPATSASANLEGMMLKSVLPIIDMFKSVLTTGEDLTRENFRLDEKLYDITIFSINRNLIVGGIIQNVTRMQMKREKIAKKASEVITKNLSTVQNVVCILGEHMAETEMLLRSIAEDFGTTKSLEIKVSSFKPKEEENN